MRARHSYRKRSVRIQIGFWSYVHVLEISGEASADTRFFGGGVYADENELGFQDGLVDICREEEIASTSLTDDILEARFVDRKFEVWRVPGVDTSLIEINDGDLDVGTLESDYRASGTTDVASWKGKL